MQTRFVAYDRLGDWRGVLPHPLEATPVIQVNDLGTLNLHYDRVSLKHHLLDNDPEVALEYHTGGVDGTWVEVPNARYRFLGQDFDHLEEIPTRTYEFIGLGEAIRGIKIYAAYGNTVNDEGEVQFKSASAGSILKTIWDNAVSRGWKGYSYNFTSSLDSDNKAWDKYVNVTFSIDTSLSSVLDYLVAQGLCDFRWVGRRLEVYNPDGAMAVDLTLGSNPISLVGTGGSSGVDSAPEQTDSSELATHVIVLGEGGNRWVFPTGLVLPDGRKEITLSYSGVDDEGTALILAEPTITKARNIKVNTTRQFHLTSSTKVIPFVSYNLGNWVTVQRGTELERMRIITISLIVNSNGTQGFVSLGDRIDDILSRMYEKIQRLNGGVNAVGTTTPTPVVHFAPKAPTSLIVSSSSYVDGQGRSQGQVAFSFAPSGLDVKGNPISIARYAVSYQPTGHLGWTSLMDVIPPSTGDTYSPLALYNNAGAFQTYTFRVIAYSTAGLISEPSDTRSVTMAPDTAAPPKPTLPSVTFLLGVAYAKWDGLGLSPTNVPINMPADFHHVNVYMGTTPVVANMTKVGQMSVPMAWPFEDFVLGTTIYFSISAVDHTGNESQKTAAVSVSTGASIDIDKIFDRIDASKLTILNAQDIRLGNDTLGVTLEGIQNSVDSKASIINDTGTPAPPQAFNLNDNWRQWTTLGLGGKLIASWRHNGTAWVAESMDPVYLPQVDIAAGTFGSLSGSRIEVGSLIVGSSGNMFKDAAMIDPTGWSQPNVIKAGLGYTGGNAVSIPQTTELTYGNTTLRNRLIGYPGHTGIRVSFWLKQNASSQVKVKLRFYAVTATGTAQVDVAPDFQWANDGEWTNIAFITPPPVSSGSPYNYFTLMFEAVNRPAVTVLVSDIYLQEAVSSVVITPGGITAESISAGAINVNHLAANSVTAAKANIGSLRAGILTANTIVTEMLSALAITSKHTITGATIQTSDGNGARIVINTVMTTYNSANQINVRIGSHPNGIEVRDPITGFLRPLSDIAFGTLFFQWTNVYIIANAAAYNPTHPLTTNWVTDPSQTFSVSFQARYRITLTNELTGSSEARSESSFSLTRSGVVVVAMGQYAIRGTSELTHTQALLGAPAATRSFIVTLPAGLYTLVLGTRTPVNFPANSLDAVMTRNRDIQITPI